MRGRLPLIAALLLVGCGGGGTDPSATDGGAAGTSPTAISAVPPSLSIAPSPQATDRPAAWTQLSPGGTAPAAREDHTWTVGGDGATAYLFGGRDGAAVFADLWTYDVREDAWSAVATTGQGPPARFGHEAAWVDGIGLVIFAGQAGTTFFNDLWAYSPDDNAWRSLPANGAVPVPRYGTCAALGPDDRLWISHGFTQDGTRFSDTRAYDFETLAWTDETPNGQVPVARCLHGCFWSPDDERFILYAGQTTGVDALGDLWSLDPVTATWTRDERQLPADRNLYALARTGDDAIVFGGASHDGAFLSDLFRFTKDLSAEPIEVPGTGPPGRRAAELIEDARGERLLLFGGWNETGALRDLWELRLP